MGQTGYIPQWYDDFETHLDEMLDVLTVDRSLPEPPAYVLEPPESVSRWRTNKKRSRLATFLRDHPTEIRQHLPALMDTVVHDLNASFNEFLILPLIAAVGHRPVHEGILERLERGSFIEQLGALAAWYTAQPGLHYRSTDDRDRGDPTPESSVRYSEWLELQPRYRQACQRAVESCEDPQEREYLRKRATGFSEIVSIGRKPTE